MPAFPIALVVRRAFVACLKGLLPGGLLLATFLTAADLIAQPVAPGMRFYRTIRTPHFSIHYPRQREKFARRMGVIAERAHARLAPKYRSGAEHTHVVLVFDSDLVNAFAFPAFGLDQIVLYLDSPRLGSFARFDLWAEAVFIHEYTHILSLRYTGSFWTMAWRLLTGAPPNLLNPPGFIEGVAVHEESQDGKGRLFDALTNMQHRVAMLDGTYPNKGETLAGSHRWPFGTHIYLFGGRFYDFLAKKYGAKRMAQYWRLNYFFPFQPESKLRTLQRARIRQWRRDGSLNNRGRNELRLPRLQRLYDEFMAGERRRAEALAADVRAKGVTPFRRMTFDGYNKSFLMPGPEGKLLYFASPRDRPSGVFRLDPEDAKESPGERPRPERLRRSATSAGFAFQAGREIYSEPRFMYPGIYGFRYELYQDDFFDKRLNKGKSSSYPVLSRDRRRLYFVERDDNERRLVMAETDEDGRITRKRAILKIPLTGLMQFTALSPDDRKLAVVVRRGEKGNGSILLCDVGGPIDAQVNCPPLVGGDSVKIQPRFSTDGERVLFSSDADGIYNLYSVDIASGEARRLTRTVGGFFAPAPLGRDLYALGYFREGYDVVRIRNEDLLAEQVDFFAGSDGDGPVETDAAAGARFRETAYWGPLEMRPFLIGLAGTGIVGATLGVGARDPLSRHFFAASWDFLQGVGQAQYDYNRFVVGLSLSYQTNGYRRRENPICQGQERDLYRFYCADASVGVESSTALLRYAAAGRTTVWQFLLGGVHTKIRNAHNLINDEFEVRDINLSGPAGVFLVGDTEFYPESISPEQGYVFFVSSRYYHEDYSYKMVDRINSEPVSYGIAEGGFSLYLPSFWSHHVNYLGGFGYGTYGPDRETQKARLSRFVRGQDFNKSPTDHAAAVFTYEYRFPLALVSDAIVGDHHGYPGMIRKIGAGVFIDYGTVFDRYPYREDWVGAYGVALTVGLNFMYLTLPELRFTVARGTGPAGEVQAYMSFSAAFGGAGQAGPLDVDEGPAYRRPYRPGLPVSRSQTGYWRDPYAGGVLE